VSNIRLAVVVIPGHDAAATSERAPDGEPLLNAVTTAIAHTHLKPASLQNEAPLE